MITHVHDELILEVPTDRTEECKAAAIAALMQCPAWVPGLPLTAEGKLSENLAM